MATSTHETGSQLNEAVGKWPAMTMANEVDPRTRPMEDQVGLRRPADWANAGVAEA